MFEEELDKLLRKDWSDEEKTLWQRIIDGLLFYKRILPKTLKTDILLALQLCNNLKDELEEHRKSECK